MTSGLFEMKKRLLTVLAVLAPTTASARGRPVFIGMAADDFDDAGLTEMVTYGLDGEVEVPSVRKVDGASH